MKKYYVLLAFCLYMTTMTFAGGRIRSIIFADSYDPRIGTGVQGNLQNMEDLIYEIGTALDMEDDIESPLTFAGNDCSVQNLRNCLNNFSCGSNDIVIFCYFGHGTRARNDKSMFPQMCVREVNTHPDDYIPLEDVETCLKAKNPRLLLVLGDCCNSVCDAVGPKFGVLGSAAPTVIGAGANTFYKQLFLDFSGSIIMSGSLPGKYSLYFSPKEEVGYGWFTNTFINSLYLCEDMSQEVSWNSFLKGAEQALVDYSTEMKRRYPNNPIIEVQTPIYRVTPKETINNNRQVNNDKQKVQQNPVPQTMTDRQITQQNNNNIRTQGDYDLKEVIDAMRTLSDTSRRKIDRIRDAEKIYRQFFDTNVTVEIVGRDGKTILDTYSGKSYLSHIATVDRLRNFSIKKVQMVGGKISCMLVHEIYAEQ